MTDKLIIWTIFDKPDDYPEGYIARAFNSTPPDVGPTTATITGPLEEIRKELESRGLYCINRHPNDHPNVVESWL